MAYVSPNFKTKKALKEAVAAGKDVTVYDVSGLGSIPSNGVVCVEGPHYPAPHTWYATLTLKNNVVISVK